MSVQLKCDIIPNRYWNYSSVLNVDFRYIYCRMWGKYNNVMRADIVPSFPVII